MNERYWDRVAADYDGEIFSSFESDQTGVLVRRLDEFADRSAPAADAGCGVGKYLPALVERFASVDAYDISGELLKQARKTVPKEAKVRFFKRDFASQRGKLSPVQFAICANVLIMADERIREGILRSVGRLVIPGGHVLFIVPSLESALLSHNRMVEWNRRDGMSYAEAVRASEAPAALAGKGLLHGLVPLEGVPTKHHLKEEAVVTLRAAGFEPMYFDKVEYGWDTQFASPPEWMGAPYTWDWLITARRQS